MNNNVGISDRDCYSIKSHHCLRNKNNKKPNTGAEKHLDEIPLSAK